MDFIFKKFEVYILLLIAITVFPACASQKSVQLSPSAPSIAGFVEEKVSSERMLVWNATLTLEVDIISNIMPEIISLVEKSNGYIENKSIHGEKSAHLKIRIPANNLKSIVDNLAQLGIEKRRYISSEDVTEQYIDTEARLKNAIALRDRLKELLKKAKDVKDIIEIEKELTRIQSDIDSMDGRLKKLKGSIEYASLDLYLEQKTILGPLGYLAKSISWVFMKLFIIRQ